MSGQIYYYTETKFHTVKLLRCFGETGEVVVPDHINGMPVAEIGRYCFSPNGHLEGKSYEICRMGFERKRRNYDFSDFPDFENPAEGSEEAGDRAGAEMQIPEDLREQCGNYITRVILPDGMRRIEAYAFYGCRKLVELQLPACADEIENDAFMNCTSLHRLGIFGQITEPSGLRRILEHISWELEVRFLERKTGRVSARIYYPEYLESYDEIGPAHCFLLSLEGEGFRARESFFNGRILFKEYDEIFVKVSLEETEAVACRMAFDRVLYPVEESGEALERYRAYLCSHQKALAFGLIRMKEKSAEEKLRELEFAFREKLLGQETLEELLVYAAEQDLAELSVSLMKWKRLFFTNTKKRYDLDDLW